MVSHCLSTNCHCRILFTSPTLYFGWITYKYCSSWHIARALFKVHYFFCHEYFFLQIWSTEFRRTWKPGGSCSWPMIVLFPLRCNIDQLILACKQLLIFLFTLDSFAQGPKKLDWYLSALLEAPCVCLSGAILLTSSLASRYMEMTAIIFLLSDYCISF